LKKYKFIPKIDGKRRKEWDEGEASKVMGLKNMSQLPFHVVSG
jgi:hypothetical protein